MYSLSRLPQILALAYVTNALPTEFVALVPNASVVELQEDVQTKWTFLTHESKPTPEELEKVSVIVPSYGSWGKPEQFPSNKVLQLAYTGYDKVNFSALPDSWSVAIVHQAGTPIAEYVLSNLLSWNIGQAATEAEFRKCTWKTSAPGNSCNFGGRHKEIHGQTLGIVGYGHIGEAIATRAAAFGMKISAVDVFAKGPPPSPLSWWGNDTQLSRLMSESDFVVLAVPLLPSTRGMINATHVAEMKSSGVLVNIARGPVVQEKALYDALKAKRIGGAILDVWWHDFEWEKSPGGVGPASWPADYDFTALDNVVMTPHFSSETVQSRADAQRQVAANLDHLARGEPLDNVVRNGTTWSARIV